MTPPYSGCNPVKLRSLKHACRRSIIVTCTRMDQYDIACVWMRHTIYYISECTYGSLRMYTLCIFVCGDMQAILYLFKNEVNVANMHEQAEGFLPEMRFEHTYSIL